MRWSKLKQLVEGRMSPSLDGRIELHRARYRAIYDEWGRGWITVDKHQVWTCEDDIWFQEHTRLRNENRAINRTHELSDPSQQSEYYRADEEADKILEVQGIMFTGEFDSLLKSYLSITIDDARNSDSPLLRALAMTDRRLGKRRLRALVAPNEREHQLVKLLFTARCSAEGIDIHPRRQAAQHASLDFSDAD